MINPYHEKIDIQQIINLQSVQHQTTLYMENEIPAQSNIDMAINITSLGHFMNLFITGDFTTKIEDDPVTDDGICQIYLQLFDGTNSRELFTEPVPANLILSPGRSQIISGVGDASEPLRIFFPFVYTFPMNGQIIMRAYNNADYVNRVRITYTGIRIFPDSRGA